MYNNCFCILSWDTLPRAKQWHFILNECFVIAHFTCLSNYLKLAVHSLSSAWICQKHFYWISSSKLNIQIKPGLYCALDTCIMTNWADDWWKCCSTFQIHTHTEGMLTGRRDVWLHNPSVTNSAQLSLINKDFYPADSSSDHLTNSWVSIRELVSPLLMQSLIRLSASLETDKTGVWHRNSSQRIQGSTWPASLVRDIMRRPMSSFQHWGSTS